MNGGPDFGAAPDNRTIRLHCNSELRYAGMMGRINLSRLELR